MWGCSPICRPRLRPQFLRDGNLPVSDVFADGIVKQALKAIDVVWNDRIYTPLVTLCIILSHVVSVDHSCRAAVPVRWQGTGKGKLSPQNLRPSRVRKHSETIAEAGRYR